MLFLCATNKLILKLLEFYHVVGELNNGHKWDENSDISIDEHVDGKN